MSDIRTRLKNITYQSRPDWTESENRSARRYAVSKVVRILAVKPHKAAELRWRTGDAEIVNDSVMHAMYIHEYSFCIAKDGVKIRSLNTTYGRALAFVFGLIDELVWPEESEDAS